MTAYNGDNSSETLNSTNWNYAWDTFLMFGGNDRVVTPSTGKDYDFYGYEGDDYFLGDSGNDDAYGGADNDHLRGNGGSDHLFASSGNDICVGGYGVDYIDGSDGNDRLIGGRDKDHYYSGEGSDQIVIGKGHSYAARYEADVIYDWDSLYDEINSPLRGTSENYGERASRAKSIDAARAFAEKSAYLKHEDHAFVYNADTDVGYLLSDLDHNGSFETGVVLEHAGSASDMNWSNII